MTSVFNTNALLPCNHDLFESLIVKKRIKMDGEGTYCCLTTIIIVCKQNNKVRLTNGDFGILRFKIQWLIQFSSMLPLYQFGNFLKFTQLQQDTMMWLYFLKAICNVTSIVAVLVTDAYRQISAQYIFLDQY
ncbi:hypothetical protein CLF_104420 [Clonorchis sinensis]|uniref:Uncharacterized protein n=1 Tax=Clonorchis sinensis TaxID=79923 RepID=G7YBM6_CLOSI|nr:hypothetical protein CLF_104420 [Clonorchis sinensis]